MDLYFLMTNLNINELSLYSLYKPSWYSILVFSIISLYISLSWFFDSFKTSMIYGIILDLLNIVKVNLDLLNMLRNPIALRIIKLSDM